MTITKPGLLKLSTGDQIDPMEVDSVYYLPSEQRDGGVTRPYAAVVGLKSGRNLTYTKTLMSDAVVLRDKLAAEVQAGILRPTTINLDPVTP